MAIIVMNSSNTCPEKVMKNSGKNVHIDNAPAVNKFIETYIKPHEKDGDGHIFEDALYEAVMIEVAAGNKDAQNMAQCALKTKTEMQLQRWFE
jgi:hypothetical protein|nr:MAG TPA: hypothetical protein [Caudoviricetes sp.]